MSPEQRKVETWTLEPTVYSLLCAIRRLCQEEHHRRQEAPRLLLTRPGPDILLSPPAAPTYQALHDTCVRAMSPDRYRSPTAATLGRMLLSSQGIAERSGSESARRRATSPWPPGSTAVGQAQVEGNRWSTWDSMWFGGVRACLPCLRAAARCPSIPRQPSSPLSSPRPFMLFFGRSEAVCFPCAHAPPIFAYGPGWGVLYLVPRRAPRVFCAEASEVGGTAAGATPSHRWVPGAWP